MKVIGIVVEYNPLHNGHIYQINEIKKMYPDSIIVVAMSGYFTMRGEVSILSKWDKAYLSLLYGVDMVLEIPFIFTNQSADTFSACALKILNEVKIDTLVFGSESGDTTLLYKAAKAQINNKEFDECVKEYIDMGYNYPTSLGKSLKKLYNIEINKSNDLLGVSYIKEIIKNNYNIDIVTIKRTNDYLDTTLDSSVVSANNIREKLKENKSIEKYVPKKVIPYIKKIDYDYLFNLVKYKIISSDSISNYHLVKEGLDNRIVKYIDKSTSFDNLIDNIKSKRFTNNMIRRILINILIGIDKSTINKCKNVEYIRVLGLSKNGSKYLKNIKKSINLPIINKFINNDILEIELRVSKIYSLIIGEDMEEEKRHTIML